MFNSNLSKCPWCGCWHDDGHLIQTENPDETCFVCFNCAEHYYYGVELEKANLRRQKLRDEQIKTPF